MGEKKQRKFVLEFEKPLQELYEKIEELKKLGTEGEIDLKEEIEGMEKRAESLKKRIYNNLTPVQIVQLSRHPLRPTTLDLANLIFDDFTELHGDRAYKDDQSIIAGLAELDGHGVVIIGHQKGRDTKENIYRNFGMSHPEGYRKALRVMKLGQKFDLPIITFIDTPGTYPGLGAEERGQASSIAFNLREMSGLKVPIISIIVGEGGSGGALGIAVANTVLMLEYAIYSVISPEGCASILFRDAKKADEAAKNLKITSKDLKELGIIDKIISEPLGGAHNDHGLIAKNIKKEIISSLKKFEKMSGQEIEKERVEKFRKMGVFSI